MYTKYLDHWDRYVCDDELKNLNEEILIEMANISPSQTGLPYKIWIDQEGVRRDVPHNYTPRIKIYYQGGWLPIEVNDNPDIPKSVKKSTGIVKFPDMNKVYAWIKAYKPVLEAHFFDKINDATALKLLGKIEDSKNALIELDQMISLERVLKYKWDINELLYRIEFYVGSKLEVTDFALDDNQLHIMLSKMQSKFGAEKIINLDNKK